LFRISLAFRGHAEILENTARLEAAQFMERLHKAYGVPQDPYGFVAHFSWIATSSQRGHDLHVHILMRGKDPFEKTFFFDQKLLHDAANLSKETITDIRGQRMVIREKMFGGQEHTLSRTPSLAPGQRMPRGFSAAGQIAQQAVKELTAAKALTQNKSGLDLGR
jgi:hypothetical protein